MSKLIVQRSSEWNNSARNFQIILDNSKLGTIADGESREFELEPGKHRIKARIDWCGSRTIEFEIKESETKTFAFSGFRLGSGILPVFVAILILCCGLEFILKTDLYLFLLLPLTVFAYPMYYISFGKNRYLRVTEIK